MTVQVAWLVAMEPLVDPDAPAGVAPTGPVDEHAGTADEQDSEQPGRAGVEPVVELFDVVAVLGSFPALAGASLVVHRGEIVLLRGPNGAGKSTLLRVCAGLVPLARGEGRVAGCDLRTQRQAVRERVGLLGHANGLYTDLTVRQNVSFWGATVGASTDEVNASLDRLGLAARLADITVGRLSAGQKRRTALACLVARRSQVWLLDEPHAGLDAAGRDDLDATLRTAVQSGATVIVASHELERAGSLATRVVDVVGGQVHEHAGPHNESGRHNDAGPGTMGVG